MRHNGKVVAQKYPLFRVPDETWDSGLQTYAERWPLLGLLGVLTASRWSGDGERPLRSGDACATAPELVNEYGP